MIYAMYAYIKKTLLEMSKYYSRLVDLIFFQGSTITLSKSIKMGFKVSFYEIMAISFSL